MYNPYQYNSQLYMNDLQNMRDKIDRQMQQLNAQQPTQQAQTPQINQNFQLVPTQSNQGIKYVNDIEDVRKELVFADTLFVNKEYSSLWFKNASGEIKTYELKEVVFKDEKDLKIQELENKLNMLLKEKENEQYASANVNGATSNKKPSNGKSDTTSHE